MKSDGTCEAKLMSHGADESNKGRWGGRRGTVILSGARYWALVLGLLCVTLPGLSTATTAEAIEVSFAFFRCFVCCSSFAKQYYSTRSTYVTPKTNK